MSRDPQRLGGCRRNSGADNSASGPESAAFDGSASFTQCSRSLCFEHASTESRRPRGGRPPAPRSDRHRREARRSSTPPATGRPAAFFDLDKTIIAKSSTLAFSKPFQAGGLISRRAVLRSAYAQFVYLVGGADHDQMEKMREFLSELCAGWDVQTVRDIVADTLHNIVDPLVYDEAVSLIEEHHLAGRDVIIVSASGHRGGRADRGDARRRRRGGHPDGDGRRSLHRRDRLLRLRREQGRRDAPARRGARLRPGPQLRLQRLDHRRAHARGGRAPATRSTPTGSCAGRPTRAGWPVLVFTRPVALRSRMRLPQSRPTLAALALGTAAAVGGAVYVAARRRVGRRST